MTVATAMPLRFRIGARTLAAIPRRLVRVGLTLDDVLAGGAPVLPPAAARRARVSRHLAARGAAAAGRRARDDAQRAAALHPLPCRPFDRLRPLVRRTVRQHALWAEAQGEELAQVSGGTLDIRRYATPDEVAAFHPLARAVSATTYQERLLDAGLPADAADLVRLAAADRVRAWLLFVEDRPVAYLCGTAEGSALIYDYVGHDPALGDLSPGSVLQMQAMRDLFAERRFARFDFTEGEGQHKRQLATGGTACLDLLLLRPTLANRTATAALAAFDGAVAAAKRGAVHPALHRLAKRVRRA